MSPRPKHQWNEHAPGDGEQPVSRSQRKRDSHAVQQLGEDLTTCSPAVQNRLPLSDDLRAALAEWRNIPSREGKRRQLQYIGRLMREEDTAAIAEALALIRSGGRPG